MTKKVSNTNNYWNFIAAIGSLAIMLYILGGAGIVAIYTGQFIDYSKENIPFYIEIKDNTNQTAIFSFQKKLEAAAYTKYQSVEYISKEKAIEQLQENENLTKEELLLFGENLLPDMIKFAIKTAYFEDYKKIIQEIKQEKFVHNISYATNPAQKLEKKAYHIEIILLLFVIFFIFVVVTLIQNALKLRLIQNKKSIGAMQKKDMTAYLIAKPYLKQAFKNGLLAGLLAIIALWLSHFSLKADWDSFGVNTTSFMIIFSLAIPLIGIIISWTTTKHTINKYLKKPANQWLI